MAPDEHSWNTALDMDFFENIDDILCDFEVYEDNNNYDNNLTIDLITTDDEIINGDDKFLGCILNSLTTTNTEFKTTENNNCSDIQSNNITSMSVLGVELNFHENQNILKQDYNSCDNILTLDNSNSNSLFSTIEPQNFLLEDSINIPLDPVEIMFPHMSDAKNRRRRNLLYEKTCKIDIQQNKPSPNFLNKRAFINRPKEIVDKLFVCPIVNCGKIYAKPFHLKAHMKRHSGEKPFVCNWKNCTWRFSRSDELARHKRSHSGIKPYKCEQCEKAFTRSDHLAKHKKVHRKKLTTLIGGGSSGYKRRSYRREFS